MTAPAEKQDVVQVDEDSYSIIEQLAGAMRLEEDERINAEDRAKLVLDLFEGPRKCQCCINWVEEMPDNVDLNANDDNEEENAHPLILRRRVRHTEGTKTRVDVHSIEIRNAEAREVLFEVFDGLDGLHSEVKYLIFLAPFCQFFWRWEAFETAIKKQQNESVKAILLQLRAIVKKELAEAFAVSKELTRNGVITFKYLWTLFPPGELIFSDFYDDDRFSLLQSSRLTPPRPQTPAHYDLRCRYVDWDGTRFGYGSQTDFIWHFTGTRKITSLPAFPAKYLDAESLESARSACIERGRKFHDLAGIHYKSYVDHEQEERDTGDAGDEKAPKKPNARRIVLDAKSHPAREPPMAWLNVKLRLSTGIITQTPVDAAPPGGHRPLLSPTEMMMGAYNGHGHHRGPPPVQGPPSPIMDHSDDDFNDREYSSRRRPRGGPPPPPPPAMQGFRPPGARPIGAPRRQRSIDSLSSTSSDDAIVLANELTDFQLQLCTTRMLGYCLKEKKWRAFEIDRIKDVEWNTAPFESLVLPEGYKDLILSFVESQLKEGEAFDDVINGKGGGLVILLAGEPGVGKTLTAESVAEKIHAPLYKMELGQLIDDDDPDYDDNRRNSEDAIVTAFDLASKWKAVLLIDECDLYLEKRSDASPKRNRMVSKFLQELEYYPSLLFLTTNREKALDSGIYSRIHLTINYPSLDLKSRRTIWKTFMDLEGDSQVTEEELDVLATIDVNGRRIRNITKTAKIMAKRKGRGIRFEDIKQVMWITEGMKI